jgi:predicted Zn-dependent protease
LAGRKDLLGWTARHRRVRGEQLFADRRRVEARRSVERDQVILDVLCRSDGATDPVTCGAANATVTVGEDPAPAVEFAVQAARRTRNPLYPLASPAPIPDVALSDPELVQDLGRALASLHERLYARAASDPSARLTQAEWFAEHVETRLVSSQGIDVAQSDTELSIEWIVLAGEGQGRVETILDLSRRRSADLNVELEWDQVARQTVDRHVAGAAPSYQGPVVLRGKALGTFLNSGPIATLSSGQARFSKISHWEPGKSVFRGEVSGDPLTLWASRVIPYGERAARFDEEGLPGQRVLVIQDNVFQSYIAGQRYATYLSVPATGSFGDIELPPGSTAAAELDRGEHVEVQLWSWFSPPLGCRGSSRYVWGGDRRPFSGGLLVGNSSARWQMFGGRRNRLPELSPARPCRFDSCESRRRAA